MADISWRPRLAEAIERSGKSERAISRAIGRTPSYLHSVLKENKQPSIDNLVLLATELNVSLTWLIFGVEMSGDAETLLKLYAGLTDDQKGDFLRMAKSVAALSAKTAP